MAVECIELKKHYGRLTALDSERFQVRRGSFHALLGENGAGKSTLIKAICREIDADSGTIRLFGKEAKTRSDSKRLGVRMVHQNLSLIPNLTIAENFILEDPNARAFPRLAELRAEIRKNASSYGLRLSTDDLVADLSLSERQWLEVFRAIHLGSELIILDEPTSMLSPVEADRLLNHLQSLTQIGKTVILVTHKLREVFGFADSVTVLRRGRTVAELRVAETNPDEIKKLLVSDRTISTDVSNRSRSVKNPNHKATPVLTLDKVCVNSETGRPLLDQVSLTLHAGEIFGVAGVAGNGQTHLAEIVAGVRRPASGKVLPRNGSEIRRYIPADRTSTGTASALNLLQNLGLRSYPTAPFRSRFGVNWKSIAAYARSLVQEFSIKAASILDKPSTLSGGNLQRVVLARELAGRSDVIVAHNPTSGLDLGTASFVREKLIESANQGAAILLISDDLDELVEISDTVAVLFNRRISAPRPRAEVTFNGLAASMVGSDDFSCGGAQDQPQ